MSTVALAANLARTKEFPLIPDFDQDIRPILSENCFTCHGPDSEKRQSQLRLDIPEGLFEKGRLGGPTLIPGDAERSLLFQRIRSEQKNLRMPPTASGKVLNKSQIELIRRWINSGAKYRPHWAFTAPQRPPLPTVYKNDWATNPIDLFVLKRLESEKLSPNSEADRTTLVRRLFLDLVGLPPSLDEIDKFLADGTETAYEKLVESLLESPHYGERWGRLWLDAARYADSDGFEKDKPRKVWFYRDWVIQAINRDLPYDKFIIEQIAGDLLPDPSQAQMVATGFLRNSMTNEEGGIDPEQFRMEAMFDRMDAIGKSVLGLTIQCAQCHDHKYDPLTQKEYYQMFAFLNNSHEANVPVYTAQDRMKRNQLYREIGKIETELQNQKTNWPLLITEWEKQAQKNQLKWTIIQPTIIDYNSVGGQKYLPMPDGSLLCQGYAPTKHRPRLTVRTDQKNITGFRLELLNDPNLPLGGPGRSYKGTSALTEFEVEIASINTPEQKSPVKITAAWADVELLETPLEAYFQENSDDRRLTGPISLAIDGDDATAWGIDIGPVRRNYPRQAIFVLESPISFDEGTLITFRLSQQHGGPNDQNYNLGRIRLALTTSPDPLADRMPQKVREILLIPANERTTYQDQIVFSYWRTTVSEWNQANDKIEALWKQHPEGSSQLVLAARTIPRVTHMLARGDFLQPRGEIQSGVPNFLHSWKVGAPLRRLEFARWLVDRRSPTTARSFVNRVWQSYFGIGLVETSEDLGRQSKPASHPLLLDWLAVEFMESNWSMKALHRLIVTSSTYRQSSRSDPDRYRIDPYNRLLARGSRFRVDAEIVRDIALAASGLLNRKIGGPSVYPPAPDFLFIPPASYATKQWNESEGKDRYRRALYTFQYRSVPYPTLQTFDAPNGDFSCVRRSRSNTPLQALTTLNEAVFVEAARALALETLSLNRNNDQQRLSYAFRRCLGRYPSAVERTELLNFLEIQKQRLQQGWLNPWALADFDATRANKLPAQLTPVELAAWTTVSRVLLNLDETITKE